MVKRLAFGESRNDNSKEGDDQKPSNELQTDLVGPFPYMAREAFKEFGNGEFGNPQTVNVVSTGSTRCVRRKTHNIAYMILATRTSLLAISRC